MRINTHLDNNFLKSSSDEFSVETPDETAGKDTEFSLVVSLRNK